MSTRILVGLMLAALTASGCGGGSDSSSSDGGQAKSPSTASSAKPPTVSSTIADGMTLTKAVPWRVSAKPVGDDVVGEVDFLIDGKKQWVERESPYVFNDDHQVLAPWLLGNGQHVLVAHVTTVNGAAADSTAHVTVQTSLAANKQIAGTYHRVVTKADAKRVQPYRIPSKGAFGEIPPPGRWTLHIKPNGEIVGVDPTTGTTKPFVEPYSLDGSRLTLYGPAVWRQPNPDEPNLFCDPEKRSDYVWHRAGPSLTIKNVQKTCADRDIVFVGTWTRS